MSLHDLFDLCFILGLHCFHDGVLVVLRSLLIVVTTLLKLLKSQLKLTLSLQEVLLVVVFLSLKEHDLAFPQGLIAIVV